QYLVCSKSFSRTCHAWETLLYGPFSERKPEDESIDWVVELPEDSPESLSIILSIIHSTFDIPPVLDLKNLYRLAILVDKYDLAHLLRPWVKSWLEGLKPWEGKPGAELLSWVAWVLGDEELFTKSTSYILLNARINAQRELI
ncbi:hypothetical protein GQ53DRAFT_597820, partial [Thozetella sp. PMI_491]